ncbi:MAG: protein phosphatase 2C domain-containing protein, partial [Nanoarchaeota archaeon]
MTRYIPYEHISKGTKGGAKPLEDYGLAVYVNDNLSIFGVGDGLSDTQKTGRFSSGNVLRTYARNLVEILESEKLVPEEEKAKALFQRAADATNKEVKREVPDGMTTALFFVAHKEHGYLVGFGDSFVFGYYKNGDIKLMVEPQAPFYEALKKMLEVRGDTADPLTIFTKYGIADDGTNPPRNFFGPREGQYTKETHGEKPVVEHVGIFRIADMRYVELSTDHPLALLTAAERAEVYGRDFKSDMIQEIVKRAENPEEMVKYHLALLSNPNMGASWKEKASAILREAGMTLDTRPDKIYEQIKGTGTLEKLRTFFYTGKDRDDWWLMTIDLHGEEEPKIYEMVEKVRELKGEIRKVEGEKNGVETRLKETENTLTKITVELETEKGNVTATTTQLIEKEKELSAVPAYLRLKEEERKIEERAETFISEISCLEICITRLEAYKIKCDERYNSDKEKVNNHGETIEEKRTELNTEKESTKTLETEVETLKQKVITYAAEIQGRQQKERELRERITNWDTDIAKIRKEGEKNT